MASRYGLLVRMTAKPGKDAAVDAFLKSALPLVNAEAGTTAWFAVRMGTGQYAIMDFFPDDDARNAHLNGAVAKALMSKATELLEKVPDIQKIDVLAEKLPKG